MVIVLSYPHGNWFLICCFLLRGERRDKSRRVKAIECVREGARADIRENHRSCAFMVLLEIVAK